MLSMSLRTTRVLMSLRVMVPDLSDLWAPGVDWRTSRAGRTVMQTGVCVGHVWPQAGAGLLSTSRPCHAFMSWFLLSFLLPELSWCWTRGKASQTNITSTVSGFREQGRT